MSRLLAAAFLLQAALVHAVAADVRFKTADGCLLEAGYLAPSSSGAPVFINIHGLGSNRGEWAGLEKILAKNGFGYLSPDLRGHGGSTECPGGRADYRTFSAAQWGGLSADIRSAAAFLEKKKIRYCRMVFCGASVGANLALKAAAEGPSPGGIVLLSPGLSYAGVEAGRYLSGSVPLLLAASEDDAYAWRSSGELTAAALSRGVKAVFRRGHGGHGAVMLTGRDPGLPDNVMDWARRLRGCGPR
jgi:pimeloyl-ACP methyl ester carboxylesterase